MTTSSPLSASVPPGVIPLPVPAPGTPAAEALDKLLRVPYRVTRTPPYPVKRTKARRGGRTKFVLSLVHRLVASLCLGRPLKRREQVHHLGSRADPRPANLVLCRNQRAHAQFHRRPSCQCRRYGEPNPTVSCVCGCGRRLRRYNRKGRPRRWAYDCHVRRGRRLAPWHRACA